MVRLIGLGKMGYNLYLNMIDNNIEVKAYDYSEQQRNRCLHQEKVVDTLEKLITNDKKIYWMMLPAGEVTETVFKELISKISPGSTIIDAGNARYQDSQRRYKDCFLKEINFIDIGVSGGMEGARYGACMMAGGDLQSYDLVADILGKICIQDGAQYVGEAGSGHYLKMVHNGIEYGMMQSISEGFNILKQSDLYNFDLKNVSLLFNNGSVIRSWLMELAHKAFDENPDMNDVAGIIPSSGEGKWTIEEALRLEVPCPVINQSLQVRYASNDREKFGEKVTSSLRNQFGGHKVHKE